MSNILSMARIFAAYVFVTLSTTLQCAYAETVNATGAMVDWVVNESGHPVDVKLAEKIVFNVMKQSIQKNVDPFVLLSIIKIESGFKVNATSKMGAKGLMQVIPKWHVDKIAGRKINDVSVNIEVGTTILSNCANNGKGSIKRTMKCYSSGAKGYVNKLNAVYANVKRHYDEYEFKIAQL